jgi:peptidoglycan/LPS O-acetylase OafA/YrhL
VVFFLVSGYIITHVLRTETTGSFLIRRAFRIYPLYVFAILLERLFASPGCAVGGMTLLWQLLLVGDFFGAPYALNGVEWTLRVELLFYLVMAVCKAARLFEGPSWKLVAAYSGLVLACALFSPVPGANIWSKGYVTIYGPFLLLGSTIYLFEMKSWSPTLTFVFSGYVVAQYYYLLSLYQPKWISAHFALIGLGIFLAAWWFRERIKSGLIVLALSDMTYGVYLFHNWLFDRFNEWASKLEIKLVHPEILSLVCLLLFCWLMSLSVEKYGIKLGRRFQPKKVR